MARFDPNEPPFWERKKGGGPCTDVAEYRERKYEEALQREDTRKLRRQISRLLTRIDEVMLIEPATSRRYEKVRQLEDKVEGVRAELWKLEQRIKRRVGDYD